MMRESPRVRRLRSDFRAMQQLASESSILDFSYRVASPQEPPEAYLLRFHGVGLEHDAQTGRVRRREYHEISVELGAAYPRLMPELAWRTPVFHPNISASGIVCLGGYSTHWVPSLNLAELCRMLWDMIRYENFDIESPYNREAAVWVRKQGEFELPLDHRPLRNKFSGTLAATARLLADGGGSTNSPLGARTQVRHEEDVVFVDEHGQEVVPTSLAQRTASPSDPDIVFIE